MKHLKKEKTQPLSPFLFIILDGFGLAKPEVPGNAITPKTAPFIFGALKKYPSTKLTAHGEAVGLFKNQEGNSEAGHFNIGAGRVVEQDIVSISKEIDDGRFFKNTAFIQALKHAKKFKSNVHIMGLLTDGESAHAHPEHLYALLEFFQKQKYKKVFLHLFTDGRDSPPHAALEYIREVEKHLQDEKIATIMGRFYAMDRGKTWSRTEKAYNAMVLGQAECLDETPEAVIAQAYNRGETDEYIAPTCIHEKGKPLAEIKDNDVVIFFNARSDRARQITKAFVQKDFETENPGSFKRKRVLKNLCFVAMTDFGPDLPGILTAFPSPDVQKSLAKVIGEKYKQLYISETEKYAHVTYFVNGGFAAPVNGEKRELVHSTKEYSYADHPQMQAKKITAKIQKYLATGKYNFICVNFPNADMVGHTGNVGAAKKAVATLDQCVKNLVLSVQKQKGIVVITADHGNAEKMIDPKTQEHLTEHTTNPVPFVVISKEFKNIRLKKKGKLADVAPTILKIMGIQKPKEMTGKTLF